MTGVIVNICGNIIVGQANGDLAKQVSERLGKTLQQRESISINSSETSITRSKQLENTVPVSTISNPSAGEFVGMVSDNPDNLITLKTFHSMIINDHESIKREKERYIPSPKYRRVKLTDVNSVYHVIKKDVQNIIEVVMEDVLNDPGKEHLVVRKK